MTITIADGWIKEAIGIYYPEKSFGPFQQKVRFLVLHATASPGASAQQIATNWRNNAGYASVHILINKDGSYVQGLSLDDAAWGNGNNTGAAPFLPAGNPNLYTISMEHCKDDPTYNSDTLTGEQQATSFALVAAICNYHQIPRCVITQADVSRGGIIRHADIDPVNRQFCPGPYPLAALQKYLNTGGDVNIYSGPNVNDFRAQLWRSFSQGIGRTPPREGTGIMLSWDALLNKGVSRGSPFGDEYPLTIADGTIHQAQNFPGGTAIWDEETKSVEWMLPTP